MTSSAGVPRPGLLSQYALIAGRYERDVMPAFGPLADDFAAWIVRCLRAQQAHQLDDPFDLDPQFSASTDSRIQAHAIDLGTGTGALTRALTPHLSAVIGVDLSAPMLHVAKQTSRADGVIADIHQLPFRSGSLSLVASTFGLNAARPKPVVREALRVLRAQRGVLMVQEWGVEDDLTKTVNETVRAFTPDTFEMPPDLAEMYDTAKPWYDQLQDVEDFYDLLKTVGFRLVWVKEAAFVTVRLTIEQYMAHKLAWAGRSLAIQAMQDDTRRDFYADLRRRLAALSADGEWLDWSPDLFRLCAQK